jgi:hypothetical protein
MMARTALGCLREVQKQVFYRLKDMDVFSLSLSLIFALFLMGLSLCFPLDEKHYHTDSCSYFCSRSSH